MGYEAIGLIDSSLETVSVWAKHNAVHATKVLRMNMTVLLMFADVRCCSLLSLLSLLLHGVKSRIIT